MFRDERSVYYLGFRDPGHARRDTVDAGLEIDTLGGTPLSGIRDGTRKRGHRRAEAENRGMRCEQIISEMLR